MCKITEELQKPLDPKHVKGRKQGGATVSYVEGWHVIDEANRIFGFLNWDRETVYCKEVSRETNSNGNTVVGYEAKVRITVEQEGRVVIRDGTGNGSGISKSLYDAIEGACKEAETDAMKRALMTFGNPFGLALYDKERKNVGTEKKELTQEEKDEAALEFTKGYIEELEGCKTQSAFFELKNHKKKNDRLKRLQETYPAYREQIHNVGVAVAARLGIGANNAANGETHVQH